MDNKNLTGAYIGAIFITLIFTLPIIWILMGAFKTPVDIYSIPPVWLPDFTYVENITNLFTEHWQSIANSLIITIGATILCMIFALPCAFGLVNFQFSGNNFLADWILSTRMMPPIAAAVPLFMIFNGLGMLDSHAALIIVYAGFNLSFAVWVAMSFFRNLPKEIIEAARIEGCTWFQTFFKVALPLTKSGIATVATFVFIFSWNELLLALFLTSSDAKTFPVIISGFSTMSRTEWEFVAASTVIQALPPIIFTLFMQKHIVSGLTMGAVKNG